MTPEEHELFSKDEIILGLIPNVQTRPEIWEESFYRLTDENALKLTRDDGKNWKTANDVRKSLVSCGIPKNVAKEIISETDWKEQMEYDGITSYVHHYLVDFIIKNQINLRNNQKTRFCSDGQCGICCHRNEKKPVKIYKSLENIPQFEIKDIKTEDPRKDENISFPYKNGHDPIKLFKREFPQFLNKKILIGYINGYNGLVLYINNKNELEGLPSYFANFRIVCIC